MKSILVVEDEVPLNAAITMKLKQMGFHPLSAISAEDAQKILEKEKPDLVWLDLFLPGMNGIDFLKLLRKNPLYKDLKVVVVSVSGGTEKRQLTEQFGIIDYIVKSDHSLKDIISRVGSLA